MDPINLGIIGLLVLFALIVVGVPLAFTIGLVGLLGNGFLLGFQQAGLQLFQALFQTSTEFALSAVPIFIFMGSLVANGGMGKDLYTAVQRWFSWVPGGLAVTTVVSCAGLGAVTGVSAAGIGALGPIAMPEMKRSGYSDQLSSGALASASTLAILIPPSVAFIVYGIWTDTSIGKLFLAGVIPGLLLTGLYCLYIVIVSMVWPETAPRGAKPSWSDRWRSLPAVTPVATVFLGLLAGLYQGWFTPTEGAAIGCAIVMFALGLQRRITWGMVQRSAEDAARLTIMVFVIVAAVQAFSRFLVLTDVPHAVVNAVTSTGFTPPVIIALILMMYLVLGMVLDGMGMMILSLPFVFPVVMHLGYDPIWFGVVLTIMIEIGLLTPPVGMNCYLLHRVAPDISQGSIFVGVLPFVAIAFGAVILISVFPSIVLWLPSKI